MFISTDPPAPAAGNRSEPAPPAGCLAEALRAGLIFLAAALLLRAMAFAPAVIDSDEGLFILQAREWLRGGWALVAVWDMHPVGVPALLALGMAAMGQSLVAIRLVGVIAVAATALALHGAARAAGAPRGTALSAGLVYTGMSVLLGGLSTGTEILMAPFVAAAMAIAIRAAARAQDMRQAPGWGALAAMGLLTGWALVVKPVAFPMGCLAFALFVLPALLVRAMGVARAFGMALAYALFCATPTLLLGLAYWLHGHLDAFIDGSFMAPLRYSGGRVPLAEAAKQTTVAALILIGPLVAMLAAVLGRGAFRGGAGRLGWIALLWFAATSGAIVGPGMYYQHYFLLWLPPLALLAALGARRLAALADPARTGPVMAAIVAVLVLASWQYEFAQRFQRGIGYHQPDPVRQVAEVLRREARPGDTLFVANYHTVVYFLAGLPVPTRYIFPGHITGHYNTVPAEDMNAEIARVLAAGPRFIVVDRGWWGTMHEGAQEQIARALHDHYIMMDRVREEAGEVEIWRRT